MSLGDLFVRAGVQNASDDDLIEAVRRRLAERAEWVEAWQTYSYDKRWTPSPYLDGVEVGHYDSGRHHVRRHEDAMSACADFVVTEVRWVVERRVLTAP